MAGYNDERDRLERKLCRLLIEAREAADMNQTKLGKAVGRSQSFVSNYERAQRRLDLPDLILVCRAMEIDPIELLRKLI
ncbi:MAG TPA: helix-turn-helix transcriptional regulator [Nitrospira sp.]|jgi:transcriptional regulator with XRE-family HTH domain|nr:helix-turn-helix transcriptional regulator [Nitrospira sp.]